MEVTQNTLLVLLLILFLGLVIPRLARPLRLPFSSLLILAGALLGPHALGVIEGNEVVSFFSFLGFTFLMFMAGLETDLEAVQKSAGKIGVLAVLNATIPFGAGVLVARLFHYPWPTAFLLGALFISTSVAVAIPAIKNAVSIKKETREAMVAVVVLEDILSLIFIAILFQSVTPTTALPLPLYFVVLFISVVFLIYALPLVAKKMLVRRKKAVSNLEQTESEVRFSLVVLIAVLIYFSALGVHPILGAFLAGLMISQSVPTEPLDKKFHVIGYGLFIPIFFVAAGMQMDLEGLFLLEKGLALVLAVVASLMFAKFVSGYVGGVLSGFGKQSSAAFGLFSTAQLTTTLAAAFAAFTNGLIDNALFTSIMLLSVVSTIVIPIIYSLAFNGSKKQAS